ADTPFDLPKGWAWARFPELGVFGRGKSKHRPRNDPKLFSPGIYPLVQTGEVSRSGNLISEYHSKYSEVGLAQSKLWPEGTLCITIAANIADSAILGFEACFPDSVVGFVPAKELQDKVEYFLIFMKTAREKLLAFAPSTAQKNINLQILESVLIPVPPKEEIERILRRMSEINYLCGRTVESRSKSLGIGKLLVEATVSTLTGIAIEQEEEPMKAPKTELVSLVRLGTPPDVKAQAPLATILVRHNGEMSAKDLWQRFGGEIDAFYAQLKTEVAHGWLMEPTPAEMLEK
ncbi:restriction modification system DNA specificity domain protein, partial [Halomonas sp. HAL1]